MIHRLWTLGRPAAEALYVSRAAAAAGIESSATSFTRQLASTARDGGRDASTSYAECGQASPQQGEQQLRHHHISADLRGPSSADPLLVPPHVRGFASRPSSQPPNATQSQQPRPPQGRQGRGQASPATGPKAPQSANPASAAKARRGGNNMAAASAPGPRAILSTATTGLSSAASAAATAAAAHLKKVNDAAAGATTVSSGGTSSDPRDITGSADAGHSSETEPPSELQQLQGLDMESLMRVLLHPLPMGRVRNPALFSGSGAPVVQLGNELLFYDPSATLSSTMRALHVVRQVLRTDGHVLIVNPNPTMRPLLREAAHLSLNSNLWFWYDDWTPGLLSDPNRSLAAVLSHRCQPNQRLMHARGLALRNPLALQDPRRAAPGPAPQGLAAEDMRRLLAMARQPVRGSYDARRAAEGLAAAGTAEARLLPYGSPPSRNVLGPLPQLALVVSLDLTYGGEAVREAHGRNIPSVSLLNAHSDASHVTFPVYASEAHAGFQHWFLEWLLRMTNMPDPEAGGGPARKRRPGVPAAAAAAGMGP